MRHTEGCNNSTFLGGLCVLTKRNSFSSSDSRSERSLFILFFIAFGFLFDFFCFSILSIFSGISKRESLSFFCFGFEEIDEGRERERERERGLGSLPRGKQTSSAV
jgi:hypothetical protein